VNSGGHSGRKVHRRPLLLAAASAAVCMAASTGFAGTTGTYSDATSGGLWSNSANWTGGVIANGQDGVANFNTLTLPGNNTVHLDSARTIGGLNFADVGNQYGWTLDNNGNISNVLTLSTSTSSGPFINVSNQSATISAKLAGSQGFTLTGGGMLTLSGINTYTGVTTVANGTLVLGSSASSSGNGASTTGLILDVDPQLSTITTSNGAVTGVTDLTGGAGLTNGVGSVGLSTINGHTAFSFNGASYLAGNYSTTNTAATVYAVIQPTSAGVAAGYEAIFASLDGGYTGGLELRVQQTSGDLAALNEGVAQYTPSSALPLNTSDVIAYTYNSSGGVYYLNGTAIGTTGAPNLTGSGTLLIGGKYSGGSQNEFFNGNIGTLLEYNSSQGASQITSISNFLASEYATSSTTLGTTEVNLTSSNSNLSIASGSQSVSSLAGVAGSNVYLGGGILTVGGDNTSTVYGGNISDTGPGSVGTGGQLVKTGTGTLNISGGVSNTGGVTVNSGSLIIASSGSYSTTGTTTVTGGTFSIYGNDSDSGNHTISGGTLGLYGTVSTSGSYAIGSTGTLILAGSSSANGAISFSTGGTLILEANAGNISNAQSSAVGNPSGIVYADAAITNVELLSDSSVTFANAQPTGGTGSGAVLNFTVNQLTSAGSNQTLTLGNSGFATYETTINVAGGNGYTLLIPSITNANSSYLTLNASTGNLSIPGGITSVTTLTVMGAANTSIGPITGTGPILKSGAGTLLLTSQNSYTGATNVSGGTLALANGANLGSTPAVTLLNGSTLDISANPGFALPSSNTLLSGIGTINGSYNHSIGIIGAGSGSTVGTLAVNGSLTLSGGSVNVTLNGSNNSTGGVANDLISVTGALDLIGSTPLTVAPVIPITEPVGTTWTVLTYNTSAGLVGSGSFSLASRQFSLVPLSQTPGAVELKYTSSTVYQDVWTGSVNNNWDTVTTNFVPAGQTTPIAFNNGDAVTFNDSSSVVSVNLSTTVEPNSITVNTNTNQYVFSGTGSISGPTGLLKQGTSTLTINNSNTYTGTTNIAGGTLATIMQSGTGIGTGPLIIGPGGTLQIGDGSDTGSAASGPIIQNSSITDNGTIIVNGRPDQGGTYPTIAGINGSGSVVVTSGVYTFNGAAATGNGYNFSGGLMLVGNDPDVEASQADSLGTGLVTVDITTTPGTPGNTLDLGYGTFTYANGFNLSGYALQTYGVYGSVSNTTTITGPITLFDQSSAMIDLYQNLVIANSVTSANNQTLIIRNYEGVSDSVTFSGNVSLGTGNLQSGSKIIFAPPTATTITIATAGIQDYGGRSASVQQNGLGTTILDGSNTYSGGTTVTTGTLVFNSPNALPNFSALTIGSAGVAQVANYNAGSTKNTLFTSSLSIAVGGKLDVGNNDLVVQNGSLSGITAEVALGYNGGKWNGASGITSSAAAADNSHLHALGVIQNVDANGNTLYGGDLPSFDGASQSSSTDILVKYTYYGDANLDGKVDGSDYALVDNGFLNHLTGWNNGDFNYDGVVNGSDYTLMDNAFNQQGAQISSQVGSPTALIAGGSAVPEPASLGLLALGAVGLLGRRNGRRR
jgi:autotransporter-associated beta strand protein